MTRCILLLLPARYKIEEYDTEQTTADMIADRLHAVIAGDFPTRQETEFLQRELEERMAAE